MDRRFIIGTDKSIHQALAQLNDLRSASMTLFVCEPDGRMAGTVTDGDIRRALLRGDSLGDSVTLAMNRNYRSMSSFDDIELLRACRDCHIKLIPVLNADGVLTDIVDLTVVDSCLPVDAVLMAGGKGERLRPLTLNTPKPLLKVGDRAIIDHNIDRLCDFGIRDISVTVNYLKEQLIDHFAQPNRYGVKVNCIAEERFLGTIGSLTLVPEFHNDTILVMNSDLLTDIDYEDFYLHFKRHDAMMAAAAIPYTVAVPYGIFTLEGREIKGVEEKPTYIMYANAGIYLIRKEALKFIPEGEMFNATDLIVALAEAGQRVVRYPLSGLWIDIGSPTEYAKASELVKHLNRVNS